MTANVLQLNVYFDTLSEQVIETKATYKVVCEISKSFQNFNFHISF